MEKKRVRKKKDKCCMYSICNRIREGKREVVTE